MMFRNKHLKPGKRCHLSLIIWSILGIVLLFHLYTLNQIQPKLPNQIQPPVYYSDQDSITKELETVEEEPLHVTTARSRRHRNPRAVRRKGSHKPPTIIDEFLDKPTEVHELFFPDMKSAVNPLAEGNDSTGTGYIYPGQIWLDIDGKPIQAHGGGILYDEGTRMYYWYGENKDGPIYLSHQKTVARDYVPVCGGLVSNWFQVDVIGVSCYSSKDLWSWRNEGIVLGSEEKDENHDLHKSNVLERPKVIYNDITKTYVMCVHIDNANYSKASVGVATSQNPTGPFQYLYSLQPHGCESRYMTIFKDDNGKAYLIYSSKDNTELHVSPLTDDYLNTSNEFRRIFVRKHREAPALFKFQGIYYMITSGCTGWAPNTALAHAAESMMGPWETLRNPCIGGNVIFRHTTFFSQNTFVLPLPELPGLFIFMADRWNPANLRDSRYVWLPLSIGGVSDEALEYSFGFPLWPRVPIYWHKRWRLPDGWRDL